MKKPIFMRLPVLAPAAYLIIVLLLFLVAWFEPDEFGFSFIPLIYATCPVSRLLYPPGEFLTGVVAGAAVNAGILFVLFKAISLWKAGEEKK
jgi:hypothetical protein